MTYSFYGPTSTYVTAGINTVDPRMHGLMKPWRDTHRQGVPIRVEGGVFVEVSKLSDDYVKTHVEGVDFFWGGRHYSGVSEETADLLTASGFGDHLTPEE